MSLQHTITCICTCISSVAQLAERLPSTQCGGFKSHLRQLFFFSSEKEELSLGIVALLCLVTMTEHTCTYMYYMYMYVVHVAYLQCVPDSVPAGSRSGQSSLTRLT